MITQKFGDVPFAAQLAVDDENAQSLVKQPNSDGFSFNSSPLFEVSISTFTLYTFIFISTFTFYKHARSKARLGPRLRKICYALTPPTFLENENNCPFIVNFVFF